MNKKSPYYVLIVFLLLFQSIANAQWNQLGSDIDGEASGDFFGQEVRISSDGTTVSVGADWNDGNGLNSGHVRLYTYENGSWIQKGSDIDGENAGDNAGYAHSVNADGTVVAVGSPGYSFNGADRGHVRIYEYIGTDWVQKGSTILGESPDDFSGNNLSISDDGSIVAIGATGDDGNGPSSGHVRVFQFIGSDWQQLGSNITGEFAFDHAGEVSISADGLTVAMGAAGNDALGDQSGHVRIFKFNGTDWIQQGSDIDAESDVDQSGWSVSLSSSGLEVAIGAISNDGGGSNSGHVRVYEYNGTNWIQKGGDIDGNGSSILFGISVSLSDNGSTLAVGAPWRGSNGQVSIYKFENNSWLQVGQYINGEFAGDNSGWSVSLSGDGSRVAIGAANNPARGMNTGHVRVFENLNAVNIDENSILGNISVYPNPIRNIANIDINLKKTSSVKVVVSNLLNTVIKTLDHSSLNKGANNIVWDTKDLPNGIYFVSVSSDEFNLVKKVVIGH